LPLPFLITVGTGQTAGGDLLNRVEKIFAKSSGKIQAKQLITRGNPAGIQEGFDFFKNFTIKISKMTPSLLG
jgi:hypothetical protein